MAYGGITEELLLRFGMLTTVAWVALRWLKFRRVSALTAAALISALFFAAGHLPALTAMGVGLTPDTVIYVLAWNTAFGVVAGALYCRYSLESAILAHIFAHAFAYIAGA